MTIVIDNGTQSKTIILYEMPWNYNRSLGMTPSFYFRGCCAFLRTTYFPAKFIVHYILVHLLPLPTSYFFDFLKKPSYSFLFQFPPGFENHRGRKWLWSFCRALFLSHFPLPSPFRCHSFPSYITLSLSGVQQYCKFE